MPWPSRSDSAVPGDPGRFMDDALACMNGLYGTAVRLTALQEEDAAEKQGTA